MVDKIQCPYCFKLNEIHKFCIHCGKKLPISDDQIKVFTDEPNPTCLNCGRTVEKGQGRCDCGYEFKDIRCPECGSVNEYTNTFCISCGERLWKSYVYDYKYDESHFEVHILPKGLPRKLRNTSVYNRLKYGVSKPSLESIGYTGSVQSLKSLDLKADEALSEIRSRWKVVSPNYCINCLGIIRPDDSFCTKCGSNFSDDKKRAHRLQAELNSYAKPVFDREDLRMSFKYNAHYIGSLAPGPGESQFEYRERLKWEFAENMFIKNMIKNALELSRVRKTVSKPTPPERSRDDGAYCNSNCRHYYEEYLDDDGGITADITGNYFPYCKLGHSTGGFCKYFEY